MVATISPEQFTVQSGWNAAAPLTVYPHGVARNLEYPAIPAWGFLERSARDFPDRVAIKHLDRKLTYRDAWEQSLKAAAVFQHMGVRPGDRVGILLPNVPEFLTALHGVWLAGGVGVAVSPLMVREEVGRILAETGCRVVVCLDMLAALLPDPAPLDEAAANIQHTLLVSLRDQLPAWQRIGYTLARVKRTGRWWMGGTESLHWFDDEIGMHAVANGTAAEAPVRPESLAAPALILPTGGTTGSPKAVVLSHKNVVANAWQQYHWAEQRRGEDVFIAVLPFFHSYGLSASLMTGVAMAATMVMHHRFNTRSVIESIESERASVFHAVPAMLAAINERIEKKPADLSSLRWVISGGASLDPAVAGAFAGRSGALVVEGFGLSEAGPVTHVGPLDGSARPGMIGLPLPDTEAKIVDVETGLNVLPDGQTGELIVRGPQVMSGYWNDPEATGEAIRGGWLYTGDLAVREPDGFFKIVDRKKDLIITNGWNVFPAEVERVLKAHEGVADAAVVGVPDNRRGEVVKAVVALKPGTRFDEKQLREYCRNHLAAHKRPRLFQVVEGELPKNFLGKVLRRELRTAVVPTTPTRPGVNGHGVPEELAMQG